MTKGDLLKLLDPYDDDFEICFASEKCGWDWCYHDEVKETFPYRRRDNGNLGVLVELKAKEMVEEVIDDLRTHWKGL